MKKIFLFVFLAISAYAFEHERISPDLYDLWKDSSGLREAEKKQEALNERLKQQLDYFEDQVRLSARDDSESDITKKVELFDKEEYQSRVVNIRELITQGASANSYFLLRNALRHPDLVSYLIDKGADVNRRNHSGETALSFALVDFFVFSKQHDEILKSIQILMKQPHLETTLVTDALMSTLFWITTGVKTVSEDIDIVANLTKLLPILMPTNFYLKKAAPNSYLGLLPPEICTLMGSWGVRNIPVYAKNGFGTFIDNLKAVPKKHQRSSAGKQFASMVELLEKK